jgi:hypothetical protein
VLREGVCVKGGCVWGGGCMRVSEFVFVCMRAFIHIRYVYMCDMKAHRVFPVCCFLCGVVCGMCVMQGCIIVSMLNNTHSKRSAPDTSLLTSSMLFHYSISWLNFIVLFYCSIYRCSVYCFVSLVCIFVLLHYYRFLS